MTFLRKSTRVQAAIALNALSDADLVARAPTDPEAFGILYDRYFTQIYGFCANRSATREQAEDATSQIFLKVLLGLNGFKPEKSAFRTWIFTIARNELVDLHRRSHANDTFPVLAAIPSHQPGPEDLALVEETSSSLHQLVAELPNDQAALIEMRLAGLTDREIAGVRGQSWGAVRSALSRATGRLRTLAREGSGTTEGIGD